MPLGEVIDIVGSIYAPEKDHKTNKPINHKKLQDVFNKLDSVINNDLAEKSDIPSSTEEQRYYDSNDDLVARDVYLESKSYSGNTITGVFRQENTGTNDSPVWETRYVFDLNSSGAMHLNANTPGIVFPDGSTVGSDAFNGSGQVHKYKGKDLDNDGDGRVDEADQVGSQVTSGTVQLSDSSAIVSTGETNTGNTYYLALGVQDPDADTKVTGRLFWDDSAGEHKIEFREVATDVGNPTVVYQVNKV